MNVALNSYNNKRKRKTGKVKLVAPSAGKVYINCGFNNCIITIVDMQGNVIAWASAGSNGFKGSRKSTMYAAHSTATKLGKYVRDLGMRNVAIFTRGLGIGRDPAMKAIGVIFEVMSLKYEFFLPHNGCRPPKRRKT